MGSAEDAIHVAAWVMAQSSVQALLVLLMGVFLL
jgi:hypothetical protein